MSMESGDSKSENERNLDYPQMHEWMHWESLADSVNKELTGRQPEYKQASSGTDFKENEQGGTLGGMSRKGGISPGKEDSSESTRVDFSQSSSERNYSDFQQRGRSEEFDGGDSRTIKDDKWQR